MKLVTRLMVGVAATTLASVAIATIGATQMRGLASELDFTAMNRLPTVLLLSEAKDSANEAGRHATGMALSSDLEFRAHQKLEALSARTRVTDRLEKLRGQLSDERQQAIYAKISGARQEVDQTLDEVLTMGEEGRSANLIGKFVSDKLIPKQAALFKALDELGALQSTTAQQEAKAAGGLAYQVALGMLIAAGVAMILGIGAGLSLARSLRRALGAEPSELASTVNRVSEGDLSRPIAAPANEGSILARVAHMQVALDAAVGNVRASSVQVSESAEQIAQGSQDLSHHAVRQSSVVRSTAATMSQLGEDIRHNGEQALQAHHVARGANEAASSGLHLVNDAVATMRDIDASSRKVADIIGVIDGIAFQTNILALNAAVEAARAGEGGRGFAVVAGEVRSLAQRCASAAKEINVLIDSSVSQATRGSQLMDQAGSAMAHIADSIRGVDEIVSRISSAIHGHSESVKQVEVAMMQMEETTQETTTLVEHSATAASSLREQAKELVSTMAMFKLSRAA